MKKNLKSLVILLVVSSVVISTGMLLATSIENRDATALAERFDTSSREAVGTEGAVLQDEQEQVEGPFSPVDDMHHFMEYVCEPSYKGLKAVLANEPADRKSWKSFKNHALVLAETSALVAVRGPEDPEQAKQWKQMSLAVYESGKSLYRSSGKYEDAKKHFGAMIDQCNQCHQVFAKGKHQLQK